MTAISFSEYGLAPIENGRKPLHWFDVPSCPIFAFAGMWRTTERGNACKFLTIGPNSIVLPIRPKAMPVTIHDDEYASLIGEMQERGIAPSLRAGDEARVSASATGFRRAIENLLQNAVDYAGGGVVSIERVAARVRITVADTGPGIAAGNRDRLLRPFERGEASRNRNTGGAGLGLSIVRDFATRHRGDLTLADAPGGGTLAVLDLPGI